MQQLESKVVIHNMAKPLNFKYNIPILSIHDCLYTTSENMGIMLSVMESELLKPMLHVQAA